MSAGIMGVAAGDDALVDLDEDTPLTTESAWSAFESNGSVTADVAAPDLSITVAKEQEGVSLDGWHNDYSNQYLRVNYREGIDRTIRFYVPSNYWGAYYDERVESVAGDNAVAKLTPVANGRYTAVTIKFTEKTDAVFKISQLKGKTWSFWSNRDDQLGNVTGLSTGIDGNDQWNYASSTDWSRDGTLSIENVSNPGSVAIQYDSDVSADKEVWLGVPEGQREYAPVYYFVREPANASENATVVVVSKEGEPPALRMKRTSSTGDGISSVLNDWSQIPNRVGDFVDSIFGSGEK